MEGVEIVPDRSFHGDNISRNCISGEKMRIFLEEIISGEEHS